jgi:hypothetical protein
MKKAGYLLVYNFADQRVGPRILYRATPKSP